MTKGNIGIDGRGALFYRGTGIGTYTWQLISHLEAATKNLRVFLPGEEYRNFSFQSEDALNYAEFNGDMWREIFLPEALAKEGIALYHVPQNGIGLPEKKCSLETVTIHDLIPYTFPETVGKGYLKEFLKEMPKVMERSDGMITVSQWSKKDIMNVFSYPEAKIQVIYEAPEPIYQPLPKTRAAAFLKEAYHITGDYILYVGGFGIRKNVKALINAVYLLKKEAPFPFRLVLPGKRNRDFDQLDALTESLGLTDDVIFPDYVPVSDLPYFYSGATAMVYPSLYEGFGLPPLEAMASGTPVLSSRATSLPEVLGDAVLYFDPYNSLELAEQLHRLISSRSLRKMLVQKGLQKAAGYRWEKTAAETLAFFDQVQERETPQ